MARGPKSDKIWADAVRRAVLRRIENEEGKPQKIERLADNLVELALGGEMSAIKEIGDRIDGRPAQAILGAGDDGEHTVVTKIVREIVRPPSQSS